MAHKIDSRAKGTRAETQVKDILRKYTNLSWERTPGSGALDPKHNMKGDLYIVNTNNIFAVEVKHYKDDHLTSKILTDKESQIEKWWKQAVRQAKQVNKTPLLIFKKDRGKFFVALEDFFETEDFKHIYFEYLDISILLLEDWLKYCDPRFIK